MLLTMIDPSSSWFIHVTFLSYLYGLTGVCKALIFDMAANGTQEIVNHSQTLLIPCAIPCEIADSFVMCLGLAPMDVLGAQLHFTSNSPSLII